MKVGERLIPEWPFPSYRFVPGVNAHPKKAGGHSEGQLDPVAQPVNKDAPQKNDFFRYSLDLYNHQYFWESHVYFEALWNAHHRAGVEADFFKGMIKLCAAGIKLQLGQMKSCIGHFERAKELFLSVKRIEGSPFLGFDLKELVEKIDKSLNVNLTLFSLYPGWDEEGIGDKNSRSDDES